MKKYIGTKTVMATPAVRKGGNVYLPGDEIPKSLEPTEEGYKVVYPEGHESWLPKDVFEATYHIAETEVDIMHSDWNHLNEKGGELNAIIEKGISDLSITMQAMLHTQNAMLGDYMNILALRTTVMESGGQWRFYRFAFRCGHHAS